VFSKNGTYGFGMQVLGVGSGKQSSYSLAIGDVSFKIVGRAYGLLGTDVYGRDIWSQFVWGSRVSILVGVLSAIGAVVIGTLAGLGAGLVGGWTDEIISRITDFFLVIPFLPLAVVVIFFLGQNPTLFKGIYYWIILLFVALSWPTVTRIVRSQVLIVKERAFVEASRALGGGSGHIMTKHILPNVLGLVYAQTALLVPGFILTEAALDFLAVAVHPVNTITWGIMLTDALNNAALTNAAVDYAWWWFLPPGIAIALLSLAFVMVGYALDNVFNPKLRQR
jgi:peptide/nickel transport system permease protein